MADNTTLMPEGLRAVAEELDFDPAFLRAKYDAERDKRMRPEGVEQYVEVAGDFSHYVDDPYVQPGFTREALTDEVEVVVIGGGFAALLAAGRLTLAGITDFRIVEKAGDFGGVWYWNRYPGCACDTESYVYLPLLEETNYIPTQKYSTATENYEHAQRIGKHFDLYGKALFQTQVTRSRWLDAESKWLVTTDRGDQLKARFVIQTTGPNDRPRLPGIAGINEYRGHTFHASRWDYSYTGGDATGHLDKLTDKKVAVIGTGCTAIQIVPHLAEGAKHLYVVQRTPSSVDLRRDMPTDPDWVKTLTPGWDKRRRDNFVALTSGLPQNEDLVNDGWTEAVRETGGFFATAGGDLSPEEIGERMELADFRKMNAVRARVAEIVKNPRTAESLKPWYRQFCKRPTFSNTYLPTFNRSNVTLIDTNGGGVERFTETGFIFDGKEYAVDCIIFATGFEVGTGKARRAGYETYGLNGQTLSDKWQGGFKTLHGFFSNGFPNLFHMGLNQNGASYSFTYHLDEQAQHIADLINIVKVRRAETIEPTTEAEAAWVQVIREKSVPVKLFYQQCTPGNFSNEGKIGQGGGFFDEIYGGGPIEFYQLARAWRAGPLEGAMIK